MVVIQHSPNVVHMFTTWKTGGRSPHPSVCKLDITSPSPAFSFSNFCQPVHTNIFILLGSLICQILCHSKLRWPVGSELDDDDMASFPSWRSLFCTASLLADFTEKHLHLITFETASVWVYDRTMVALTKAELNAVQWSTVPHSTVSTPSPCYFRLCLRPPLRKGWHLNGKRGAGVHDSRKIPPFPSDLTARSRSPPAAPHRP